jgi:phthalate 4,5-dioxygenase
MIIYKRSAPIEKDQLRRDYAGELTPDYHLVRNKSNRYLQDREEMKTRTYMGMGQSFTVHDAYATEGEGPIQDRTQEHLGSSDIAIATSRQMLLRAIRAVQEGGDPAHVVRDPAANRFGHLVVVSEGISKDEDWRTFWKQRVAAEQPLPANV